MINPTWLHSFCALVEIGHFTKTAQKLHMTQSGVSQHLQKLEEYSGQVLLERTGKGIKLTRAGEQMYQQSRKILFALAELDQRVSDADPYHGTVKVMSPGSVGLKLYRHLLTLQQKQPALIIDYRFAPNQDIQLAMAAQSIDIGLMTSEATTGSLSSRPVGREQLLLITPRHIDIPDWQQLQQLGFIDHPDGAHHANLLLSANFSQFKHVHQFEKKGFSNQISLILKPVSLGIGFTVLPEFAISEFDDMKAIRCHHLPVTVHETIYRISQNITPLPPHVETVATAIDQYLANSR